MSNAIYVHDGAIVELWLKSLSIDGEARVKKYLISDNSLIRGRYDKRAGLNTPLARAIMGKPVGYECSYEVGEYETLVKILSIKDS